MRIPTSETSRVTWRRSRWCGGANCVEVAVADHSMMEGREDGDALLLVRDSMVPDGQLLRIRPDAWAALVARIKVDS